MTDEDWLNELIKNDDKDKLYSFIERVGLILEQHEEEELTYMQIQSARNQAFLEVI